MPNSNTIDNQHIMHITYDMRIGGTEMVIKNIIDGLANLDRNSSFIQDETTPRQELVKRFKMSILCIESPLGPFAEDLQDKGIEFHELNRQPGFDTTLIKQIRQIIRNNNVNIIHCHQYTPWIYGVIAAMFTKTKVIFTEHGRFYPDTSSWKRKLINPVLNLFTDQVTVISKATKKALVDFENIPAKDIEVIYNGIAPLAFNVEKAQTLRQSLNIPDDHTILGTVARFDPIKNHTMMLKAFSKVLITQPKCTLLMVGDGEERKNIEQCITELNLENNVILSGYEPKPAEHIAIMDVFLLSSLSEGTSMTLLEAMSIGKPCVVTDAGGNPEIIIDNENGLVTKNDDADEFSNAITALLTSSEQTTKYGEQGRLMFKKLFSENVMNRKFASLYQWKAL